MNTSREQRFKQFCAALDNLAQKPGVDLSKMTGYSISMAAFGKKPGGDFYAFFEEWLKLRHAVPGAPLANMPADAAAEMENWTDRLKAQMMEHFTIMGRGIARSYEQTTALRVVGLERMCADQAVRHQAVIATLLDTEKERDEAQAHNATVTGELKQEREQVQRLLGRLEERDLLLKALAPGPGPIGISGASVANEASEMVNPALGAESLPSGNDGQANAPADQPVGRIIATDQAPLIGADRPVNGQVGMPHVIDTAADTAASGNDGHG